MSNLSKIVVNIVQPVNLSELAYFHLYKDETLGDCSNNVSMCSSNENVDYSTTTNLSRPRAPRLMGQDNHYGSGLGDPTFIHSFQMNREKRGNHFHFSTLTSLSIYCREHIVFWYPQTTQDTEYRNIFAVMFLHMQGI